MLTKRQIDEAANAVSDAMGTRPRQWLGNKRQGVYSECRGLCALLLREDYGANDRQIARAMGYESDYSPSPAISRIKKSKRLMERYTEISAALWEAAA